MKPYMTASQFLPALFKSPNETYYSPFQSPFGDTTEREADVLAPAVVPEESGSLNQARVRYSRSSSLKP